jgi:MFS family permease
VISLIGSWMQIIAQDWLVLELSHNSPTALGVVTALQFAPMLVLTLYGGKLADLVDKRLLLILTNITYAVLALVLGLLVITGAVHLWHVYLFAVALGAVSSIETPTRQAFASEMVGPALLPNALALSAATFNTARIIGPAIGGVAISALGIGPVFVINGLSYGAAMYALFRMRPQELFRAEPGTVSRAQARVRDGLRYVSRRADLVLPMALIAVVGGFGFNFQLTLAVLAKNAFHTDAATFGLLTTALAVGALGGALAGSGRRARPSVYVVIGAAIAFGALETITGFGSGYWTVALLLVPTGYFMIYFAQASNQRVQMGTDAAMRGRVMALYLVVFLGTTPICAPLVGWLSGQLGPRSGVWLGGAVSVMAGLAALSYQLRADGARLRLRLRPVPRVYVARPADTV